MVGKRMGALTASVVALGFMIGVVQAGAEGSPTVLRFSNSPSSFTGVGFNANDPNAIPPVGSQAVIALKLRNAASQFGKPSGAIIGRVLLDFAPFLW